MASLALNNSSLVEGDSEDEFDWEEVQVPEQRHLEITLQARPKSDAVTKSDPLMYNLLMKFLKRLSRRD
jgi:hypothetical protein